MMSEKENLVFNIQQYNRLEVLEILCATEKLRNFSWDCGLEELKNVLQCNGIFEILEHTIDCLSNNKFEEVLDKCLSFFKFEISNEDSVEVNNFIYKIDFKSLAFHNGFEDSEMSQYIKNFFILTTAIAALQVFIKCNVLEFPNDEITERKWDDLFPNLTIQNVSSFLGGNMDLLSPNVRQKNLLLLSRFCLSLPLSTCSTYHWWNIRSLMTHQRVLTDKVSSLHDTILQEYNMLCKQPWISDENSEVIHAAKVLICVEMAQMHIYYQELKQASEFIELKHSEDPKQLQFVLDSQEKSDPETLQFVLDNNEKNLFERKHSEPACSLLGLKIKLHGALGKRTRFQSKEVPQLMVKIERTKKFDFWPDLKGNEDFPKNLSLQDDTLLNAVKFQNIEDNEVQEIDSGEQLILFALCCLERNTLGDQLSEEQVLTYLNYLLEQPQVWSVHLMSLVLRSRYEKRHSRRSDRAIRQIEVVTQHLKQPRSHLPMIHATGFPTFWQLEKELADLLASVGAVRTALEVYKRYNLWHELVACYMELGQMANAREVVQKQIELKKTPLLLCLLGDIEKNLDHYHSAFELSKQTCHRSQRSLGFWYYKQRNFPECIRYFTKSVELNHLQSEVWFALGFAAGETGNLSLAAKAYRHLLHLDGDNFQAWNNLSAAYIASGEKERAWRTLQEALRCNYDEHRIWENFLCLCVDVGAFEDAIRAYHRLLDLKGTHLDVPVLKILVEAVAQNLSDRRGQPASNLKQKLLELFGRLTTTSVARECRVWELYSCLKHPAMDHVEDYCDLEKALEYQQKAVCYHPLYKASSPASNALQDLLEMGNRYARLTSLYLSHQSGNQNCSAKKCIANCTLKKVVNLGESLSSNLTDSEASIDEMILCMKQVLMEVKSL